MVINDVPELTEVSDSNLDSVDRDSSLDSGSVDLDDDSDSDTDLHASDFLDFDFEISTTFSLLTEIPGIASPNTCYLLESEILSGFFPIFSLLVSSNDIESNDGVNSTDSDILQSNFLDNIEMAPSPSIIDSIVSSLHASTDSVRELSVNLNSEIPATVFADASIEMRNNSESIRQTQSSLYFGKQNFDIYPDRISRDVAHTLDCGHLHRDKTKMFIHDGEIASSLIKNIFKSTLERKHDESKEEFIVRVHTECPILPIDAHREGYDNPVLDYPLYLEIMARWFSAQLDVDYKQYHAYRDDKHHKSIIPNFSWIGHRPWPDYKTILNFLESEKFYKFGSIFEAIILNCTNNNVAAHRLCNTVNSEEFSIHYLCSIARASRLARTAQLSVYTDSIQRGNEKARDDNNEIIPIFSLRISPSSMSNLSFNDEIDELQNINDAAIPEPLEVRTGNASRPTSNDV